MQEDWGKLDGETEDLLEEWRTRRRTQVREIEIREPRYGLESSHPGYELGIPTSDRTTQIIDLNIHEIRAWGESLIAFAEENESK